MLAAEIYPDSTNVENANGILQNGSGGVVDRVEFQYNRVGERIAKRDQNGTVHEYEYDNLGRILHDRVTTLAADVDGTVRRISTVYDLVGNVRSVTSFGVNNNVVNQVMYEFDSNGLLAKEFSNASGAVVASTPHIGYTYDVTKSGEFFTRRLRPVTIKYPSGKTLTYGYGVVNSDTDKLNCLAEIKEGTNSLVQYVFNGIATPVKISYPQPGLMLDYTVSLALDRFNRVTDHAWRRSSTDIVRIRYGYDRVGNRLYRDDAVQTAISELYSYDGVDQVKTLRRGTLNAASNVITTPNFTESWNYDGTGNWAQYNRNGTVENRTHNAANEILTNITHDRNGNMTVMPGHRGKYDAWNRLVEVLSSSDVLIARYDYNGLNHRVRKTVGNVIATSFFNRQWQELESVTGGQTTVNIWGLRYIDDIVLRERGNERLYSLADPNWNVVAVVNAAGTVQERMRYDAFGRITWLNAAFTTKTGTDFAWSRTFTGQVLDSESGLMLYRNRYYHSGLGRFLRRDPIGYEGRDNNLYRYVFNAPRSYVDPQGFKAGDTRNCLTIHTSHSTDSPEDKTLKGNIPIWGPIKLYAEYERDIGYEISTETCEVSCGCKNGKEEWLSGYINKEISFNYGFSVTVTLGRQWDINVLGGQGGKLSGYLGLRGTASSTGSLSGSFRKNPCKPTSPPAMVCGSVTGTLRGGGGGTFKYSYWSWYSWQVGVQAYLEGKVTFKPCLLFDENGFAGYVIGEPEWSGIKAYLEACWGPGCIKMQLW
jgi:RHS repeat-associated protein